MSFVMSLNKLDSVIENEKFYHHFQPLYALDKGSSLGFEAFLRSNDVKNPELLFEMARKANRLYELDTKSIRKAIHSYCKAGYDVKDSKLFINIFPSTLMNSNFSTFLDEMMTEAQINSQQIIFEINEYEHISDFFSIQKIIFDLKKQGFLVAIDDVGKGAASLRSMIELQPHYIKLDRYFAVDLSISQFKQEMIKSIVSYCNALNAVLILEGIEKSKDLAVAKKLGVCYGQGYILGKPTLLNKVSEGNEFGKSNRPDS
jgi:EAL domain-containing protein (putative c-di-GMP-specific phosphodiesterase class I)